MSYYPEPDSHIRDKVKVVLDLSSNATKKTIRSCYRCRYIWFIALKNEVDKLVIDTLVNVPTNFTNLKTKVDD